MAHEPPAEIRPKSDSGSAGAPRPTLPAERLAEIRRTRRHPRPTQFDYLHLRRLVKDLARALGALPHPVHDVVDIFCGTRPYDDLLPAGARCIGLDIDERFGTPDVVTTEFLPFDDSSFDLAMCIGGFHYVEDPRHGVAEIRRVLRPGRTALIAIPLMWEYDRTILEHRYTGPELEALFADWDDVRVVENGGRGLAWALLTGRLVHMRERTLPWRARRVLRTFFGAVYLAINGIGTLIEGSEERRSHGSDTQPVNLMLTARRPEDG